MQRALDLLIVCLTVPVWLSLLLVVLFLKLIIDGCPIFFGQIRTGHIGQPFMIYKVRTTPKTYEQRSEDWPGDSFPPRTAFGCWLRRRDLDELPQFWNVLKGEMSLVGPRPETPYHTKRLSRIYPRYSARLVVRPGLTGLAQVRGWRGDTNIYERLSSDLEYLGMQGVRVYFGVLLRTARNELRCWLGS
jgi:lipopolysaccharide/colanic/teichoic acid biosynthesis glycosyltransferase